jgi:hypothetical protein
LVVAVTAHLDVTVETPASAPGVLDQPVVGATVSTIANSEDTVVQAGRAAVGLVVHTCKENNIIEGPSK